MITITTTDLHFDCKVVVAPHQSPIGRCVNLLAVSPFILPLLSLGLKIVVKNECDTLKSQRDIPGNLLPYILCVTPTITMTTFSQLVDIM